jgi:glutamine synthetase
MFGRHWKSGRTPWVKQYEMRAKEDVGIRTLDQAWFSRGMLGVAAAMSFLTGSFHRRIFMHNPGPGSEAPIRTLAKLINHTDKIDCARWSIC